MRGPNTERENKTNLRLLQVTRPLTLIVQDVLQPRDVGLNVGDGELGRDVVGGGPQRGGGGGGRAAGVQAAVLLPLAARLAVVLAPGLRLPVVPRPLAARRVLAALLRVPLPLDAAGPGDHGPAEAGGRGQDVSAHLPLESRGDLRRWRHLHHHRLTVVLLVDEEHENLAGL